MALAPPRGRRRAPDLRPRGRRFLRARSASRSSRPDISGVNSISAPPAAASRDRIDQRARHWPPGRCRCSTGRARSGSCGRAARRACRRGRARSGRRSRRHAGPSMKICGTVVRPLARWIISSLRLAAEIDGDLLDNRRPWPRAAAWPASNKGRRSWCRFRHRHERSFARRYLGMRSTHQLRRMHHARPADQLDPRRAGALQRPRAGLGGASGGQHVVDQDDRLALRPPPCRAPRTPRRRSCAAAAGSCP